MTRWPLPPREAEELVSISTGVKLPFDYEAAKQELIQFWKNKYGDLSAYDSLAYRIRVTWEFRTASRQKAIETLKFYQAEGIPLPRTILDHGGGTGLTTAMLSMLFPDSIVYYHNISSQQTYQAMDIWNRLGRSNIVVTGDLRSADLVCSWEVLEHIREPLVDLWSILESAKVFSVTTAFNAPDHYGHWEKYKDGENWFVGKKMNRVFRESLEAKGWGLVKKTSWWNEPNIWTRTKQAGL